MNTHENELCEKSVLIVDDNLSIADTLSALLRKLGSKKIHKAGNVPEAQEILGKSERFDLVITDLELPNDRNGLEILATVRRTSPGTKVIVMSGCNDERLLAIVEKAHPDGFMAKPFDHHILEAELRKVEFLPALTNAA